VVTDVHQLYESLDQLRTRNFYIVHSLTEQLTYIKKLHTLNKLSTDALMNMSSTVNDVVVQSQDRFQQTGRDITWLNVNVHDQSELYTTITQRRAKLS
jgi:hypothetical protein